ncbi:hypothetical protein [Phenylobacterium sp.]|uniref:hypothetical protein n=1 Tax=Phenylobacterium sp. TaxID=1871053 RepID=UPI00356244D5
MSLDIAKMKRRRTVMMAICGVAVLSAFAGFVFYFKFGQGWARIAAILALLVGFGAQAWFIAGLRSPGKGV